MTCVICGQGEARPGEATVTPERVGEPFSSELRTPTDGWGSRA
jgi:hypothetical protein